MVQLHNRDNPSEKGETIGCGLRVHKGLGLGLIWIHDLGLGFYKGFGCSVPRSKTG